MEGGGDQCGSLNCGVDETSSPKSSAVTLFQMKFRLMDNSETT